MFPKSIGQKWLPFPNLQLKNCGPLPLPPPPLQEKKKYFGKCIENIRKQIILICINRVVIFSGL